MTTTKNANLPVSQATPTSLAACLEMSDELLFTEEMLDAVYRMIKAKAGPIVADVNTDEGRREIAEVSKSVGGALNKLDHKRRTYVADLKARPKQIDTLFRKVFRKPAEQLKAKIRAPLDAWEEDQRAAEEEVTRQIEALNAPVEIGTSATAIAARLEATRGMELPNWLSENQQSMMVDAMLRAIKRLEEAHAVALQAEKQAAEMVRLREIEREARDAQIVRETEERAKREAEERTAAEHNRLEQERREALLRAQEAKREAESAEQRRQQEAAAAEVRAKRDAEEAVRQERERIEAQERARREEEQRRAADREHRASIHREIAAELTLCDLSAEQAHAVVVAIARGSIPHVTINY